MTTQPPDHFVHETNRDPVAHQLSRIECFRHDAAPGASEVACALAPALAPQGWSIFLTEDGIYEWENDHWNVRIEPISDELRHQSCTKSIQGWLDAFDRWLEQYDPEAFAALRGPGLTPRHVDSLRAAFAAGSEFVACTKQEGGQ